MMESDLAKMESNLAKMESMNKEILELRALRADIEVSVRQLVSRS